MEINIFATGSNKLLSYPDKIDDWIIKKPITPITLEIHPSEICNQNCPHCQSNFTLTRKDARDRARNGQFLRIESLESIWSHPPKGIVISGNTGDPLTYPFFNELLTTIGNHKIPMVLVTNGQGLNEESCSSAITFCRGIRISLDADNGEIYSTIHGVTINKWQHVLENIRLLLETRNMMGIERNQCNIGVGFLTNRDTLKGMKSATQLSKALGLDYIQFRPYHYDETEIGKEFNECLYFEDDNFKVYRSFQKYSKFHSFLREYKTCQASWFYSVLDARGDIYLCCHQVGNKDANLGNIYQTSWQEIMLSEKRTELINSYSVSECLPFCRLNAHNQLLMDILNGKNVKLSPVKDPIVDLHSPFL